MCNEVSEIKILTAVWTKSLMILNMVIHDDGSGYHSCEISGVNNWGDAIRIAKFFGFEGCSPNAFDKETWEEVKSVYKNEFSKAEIISCIESYHELRRK